MFLKSVLKQEMTVIRVKTLDLPNEKQPAWYCRLPGIVLAA